MITNRETECKFYSFLMACINMQYDDVIVHQMPLLVQRDIVLSAYWEFSRGFEG